MINSFKKNYIFFVCYLTVLIGFYFKNLIGMKMKKVQIIVVMEY